MRRIPSIASLLGRLIRWPLLTGGLVLVILGAAIVFTTLQLRESIRKQIAGRDGDVLQAVVMKEYENDVDLGLAAPLTDPENQLSVVLKTSELRGVLGIRLFAPDGKFVDSFPPHVKPSSLDTAHLSRLKELKSSSTFHPEMHLQSVFYPEPGESAPGNRIGVPVLEANVPLHDENGAPLAGIAQFLIDASDLAVEFKELDRHLAMQAGTAFLISGGVLAFVLFWAFSRLRRAHLLVERQTQSLLKANRELALAAKTSALGSVAAHLIHGLKNPLAGLQNFVAARSLVEEDHNDGASWEQAAASTRRMNDMIQRVISVLREEQMECRYALSAAEIVNMASSGLTRLAKNKRVTLHVEATSEIELNNRAAHLVVLILENLVQNAIEASPRGGRVILWASDESSHSLRFEVTDNGPGFPDNKAPFEPGQSTKEGGSGIGLALCRQLANHLGARLELEGGSDIGCRFVLQLSTVPHKLEWDEADEIIRR